MIPKNLQHELFEEGERNRLVYLGAFDADAQRAHSDRIVDLETTNDNDTFDDAKIVELDKGIKELKRQIYELTQLLVEEQTDAGGQQLDPIADNIGYDDAGHLASAVAFTNEVGNQPPDAANFVERLTAYKTAFENIQKINFTTAISDWLPAGGDQSHEIPEIGLWSFSDILADGTVTAKGTENLFLYNEHDIEIRIPSGGTFEVRKDEPLRHDTVLDDYLIPVSYGGQELYILADALELPTPAITSAPSEGGFEYTRAADATRALTEQKFTLTENLFPAGGTTWENLITLARAYEMAKAGGKDRYKENLFSKGLGQFHRTPNGGNYVSAIFYASEILKLDPQYTNAYYLLAQALVGLKQYGAAKGHLAAYDAAPDDDYKTSDNDIARLKREVETYELLQEELPAEHEGDILALLGDDKNKLHSTPLRLSLEARRAPEATAGMRVNPTEQRITDYKRDVENLEAAMEIERLLATEYLDKGDDQPTEDLLELYFDIIGEDHGSLLHNQLAQQLERKGAILYDKEQALIRLILLPLNAHISELVTAQIEARIDFREEVVSGVGFDVKKDLPAAMAVARQLFIQDAGTFDELDVYEDGILILSLQGTVYAIKKGDVEEGKLRELTLSYVGKDGKKHEETFKAPAGMLKAVADNIGVEKGDEGKEARDLKAGLISAAGSPVLQLPAVKLAAGSDRRRGTTELVGRLTSAPRAVAEGGDAVATAVEASTSVVTSDAATTTEATPEAEGTGGEATGGGTAGGTSEEALGGPVPTESEARGPRDPLGAWRDKLSGKPQKPVMSPISADATTEDKTRIQTERASAAEVYAVDLTKWEIEKKVYRGRRDSKMAEVFRQAPIEQLELFYQQVNDMRDIKTPGRERLGYRHNWQATFLSLVGETKTGDIHLIGRPLILYNMINRVHQIAETYKLNTLDHGVNGDGWLSAMARTQYDVRRGTVSNVRGIPELEDPGNPKRLEGSPGLMTDMRDPDFAVGQTRAYRIHTSNDPDEFPFIIRVKCETGGYRIHYGEDEAVFQGGELVNKFVKMILMPALGERKNWQDIHAFRVSTTGLDDDSMENYYEQYVGNRTSEELETEIDDQLLAIMKEISKESKLPLPELEKLLDRPHSEIFSRVWAILTGVKKTGPGSRTLTESEFSAAKLYLEKLDYKLHGTYEEGDTEEEAGGKGIGYLRGVARTKWHDRSAKLEEKKDKKSGRLAGKEGGHETRPRRPSAMERLESLGLRGRMARRAKTVYYKLADGLEKKSGGLVFKDWEFNRYGVLARNSAAMDNNLGQVFGRMVTKAERLKGALMEKGVDLRGNRGAIVTRDNTVDDALLRMAALAARGESAELPCSVAYIMGSSDRAGAAVADRGEGYASPRVRRSVYRPYV